MTPILLAALVNISFGTVDTVNDDVVSVELALPGGEISYRQMAAADFPCPLVEGTSFILREWNAGEEFYCKGATH